MKTRDLTESQFLKRLEQNRFEIKPYSMFGYVHDKETNINFSRFNAGDRRRDQLAYLLAERKRWINKLKQENK